MTEIAAALFMVVRRKRYPVASFKEASERFCAARDKSGFGASRTPEVTIVNGSGETVARRRFTSRTQRKDLG